MPTTVDPDAAKAVIPWPTIRARGSAHTAVFCAPGVVTFAYAHLFLVGRRMERSARQSRSVFCLEESPRTVSLFLAAGQAVPSAPEARLGG